MTIWAVLPAAGIGRRMGSTIPKQYLTINSEPLLLHSLRRLSAVSAIKKIVVVIHPEDRTGPNSKHPSSRVQNRIITVIGGDERYQSVLNGLDCIDDLRRRTTGYWCTMPCDPVCALRI